MYPASDCIGNHLQKAQALLADIRSKLAWIKGRHPDLFYILNLHQLWSDLCGLSVQIEALELMIRRERV